MGDQIEFTTAGLGIKAESSLADSRPVPKSGAALSEFESLLISRMLRSSAKPIGGKPLFDGGEAGRMYREMFYDEIGKVAARAGGLGLSASLKDAMSDEESK